MKISKRSLIIVSIVGAMGITLSSAVIVSKLAAPIPGIVISSQTSSGLPIHLNILKAHVNATIEQIGLTPEGALDTPQDGMHAGWYNLGPRPGDVGNAVIDGHFSWKSGVAVFEDLHLVQKGDKISVLAANGVTTTFVVSKTQIYDPNADALDVFTSTDGKAHLNIITCEGFWDKAVQSYTRRFVVFSDKE